MSIEDIERAKNEMAYPADLPPLGSGREWREITSRHNIHSNLVASSTAAYGIYINTPLANADPDYLAIGTNVSQLTSNMIEAATNLRMLMTLQPDGPDKDSLLAAANRLADATQDLLNAAKDGHTNRAAQQATINAMADAHKAVLGCLGDPETESDMRFSDQATLVAQAVERLLNACEEVAKACSDPDMQGQVINASKDAAASSSQLATCIKLLGSTMSSPLCQQQLMEAAKGVTHAVEGLVHTAQNSSDDQDILNNVSSSAEEAQKALDELTSLIKQSPLTTEQDGRELSAEQILDACDKMFSSMGNTVEMVIQSKIVADATGSLLSGIMLEAKSQNDNETRLKLLGAVVEITARLERMVEAGKAAAANPINDEQCQVALQQTTEDLRQVVNKATSENMKTKLMTKLQEHAKIATDASTQLMAAANGTERCNGDPASQEVLMSQCKLLGDAISKLESSVNAYSKSPSDDSVQLNLVQRSQQFITPATRCVSAAKSAVPHVTDEPAAVQLTNTLKSAVSALVDLRTAADDLMRSNLENFERSVAERTIHPRETGILKNVSAEETQKALDELTSFTKQTPDQGRELSAEPILDACDKMFSSMGNTLAMVVQAMFIARGTISLVDGIMLETKSENNSERKTKLLLAVKELARAGDSMLEAGKAAATNPDDEQCQFVLQQKGEKISQVISEHMDLIMNKKTGGDEEQARTAADNPQLQAHISNIVKSIEDIERAKNEMAYPADLPPLGPGRQNMFNTSKQNIHSNLMASSTAAYGIYINTPLPNADPNYHAIGTNVSQLTSNMIEAATNLRMLITLQPDGPDKDNMLATGNRLAGITQDLLNAAKDGRTNRAAQQAAINAMADAHKAVLGCLGDPGPESDMQIRFLDQARLVLNKNENDETLVHLAVREKNKEALEYFCRVPNVLNMENKDGKTAFQLLAESKEYPLSYLLYLYKLPGADTVDVNQRYGGGKTLLHIAVYKDNYEEVEYLLTKYPNIDVNVKDDQGNTPLHCAVLKKHVPTVTILSRQKLINVSMKNNEGQSPLDIAVSTQSYTILWLLYKLIDTEAIRNKYDNGETLVHLAVKENNQEALEYFCKVPSVLNIENNDGKTAFQLLVDSKEYPLSYILSLYKLPGADTINVNERYRDGKTLLHIAVDEDNDEQVEHLLTKYPNLDVNVKDDQGNTPLHCAVLKKHVPTVTILSRQKSVNVSMKNNEGQSPIDIAVSTQSYTILWLLYKLIDTEAIRNKYDNGETLVHLAVKEKNKEALEYFCKVPSVLNIDNNDGKTAFQLLVDSKEYPLSYILYLYKLPGADTINVNDRYRDGKTLLHIAVDEDNDEQVEHLLTKYPHLDVNVKDDLGNTPIHCAVRKGQVTTVKILSTQDLINVSVKNNEGQSPIDIAVNTQSYTILWLLYKLIDTEAILNTYENGETLLHIAVRQNNKEALEYFCKVPSVLNIKNNDRKTAFQLLAESKDYSPPYLLSLYKLLLTYAIMENNFTKMAAFLLNQSTIDVDIKVENKGVFHILYQLLTKRDPSMKVDVDDADGEIIKSLKSAYLSENVISDEVPESLRQLLQYEDPSILEFLRNDSNISEELKNILSATLNLIILGLQKYADHESLRYSFFKGSLHKTLIEIFLDKSEADYEDTNYTVKILELIFKSLQARNPCNESGEDFIRRLLGDDPAEPDDPDHLFNKFEVTIEKLAGTNITEKCNDVQLLATTIYNAYIKKATGLLSDIKNFFENINKRVIDCSPFHYCSERGCLALVVCIFGIYIHGSDVVSDVIVGRDTLHGFSTTLGMFMLVLVVFNLLHENIRSSVALYETEKDLLRVKLGKFELEENDWQIHSDVNYSKDWYKNMFFRLIYPFKVQKNKELWLNIKALLFNLLSIAMLRPVVDRLIVLVHSPSNIRTVYRQKSKQMSLNQYFMILEQMPGLLIQFYLFQIFFNNIEESEHPKCLEIEGSGHNFSYNPGHFQCSQKFLSINMCVPWILIYSMAIPFFKSPKSVVSLEEMFRKLDPMTPKMSTVASILLYLAYIMMIPARLLLFAGLMHAVPNKLFVVGYMFVTTLIWFMLNISIFKGDKFLNPENRSCKEVLENLSRKEVQTFFVKKGGGLMALFWFSFRDVLVISLRDPIAYMSKPSDVSYDSFRSWKTIMLISIVHFIECLSGAVYIEHYYRCGMETEIFKYQGWGWLALQVFSASLLILLSYVLKPQRTKIISVKFMSKSVQIIGFGLVMCLSATAAFFLSNYGPFVAKTIATTVVFLFLLLLFVVTITCLKYLGEAKTKKEELVEAKVTHEAEQEQSLSEHEKEDPRESSPLLRRSEVQQGSIEMMELPPEHEEEEEGKETSPLVPKRDVDIV